MADSIHVKLPDGSVKEVPKGTTALDIAKSISPRLADAALVAGIVYLGAQEFRHGCETFWLARAGH